MPYAAGSFYFPTSTGSFSLTGWEVEPQGVLFFGGNQATEDALISGPGTGLFFGMAWRDIDTNAIDSQSQSLLSQMGASISSAVIRCCGATGNVTDYKAFLSSFDGNGVTLNVVNAAPGLRLVHFLAWGDFDEAHGKRVQNLDAGDNYYDWTLANRAFTGMALSTITNNLDGQDDANVGFLSFGCGNWSEDITENPPYGWQSNGMSCTGIYNPSFGGQPLGYTQQHLGPSGYLGGNTVSIALSLVGGIGGTSYTGIDWLYPYPTLTSSALRHIFTSYYGTGGTQWWSGEGYVSNGGPPSLGNTTTIQAAPNVPGIEAVLFFGTMGYGTEDPFSPPVAYFFGVLTEDYQGCVGFDSGRDNTGVEGFFQSKQYCSLSAIQSPGVNAASGEIQGDEIVLTGELNGNPGMGGASNIQMWGDYQMSQFFRVVRR